MPLDSMNALLEWWELNAETLYAQPDPLDVLKTIAKNCAGKVDGNIVARHVLLPVLNNVLGSVKTVEQGFSTANVTRYFHVVDAFDIPAIDYDGNAKQFIRSNRRGRLLADAQSKSWCLKTRYDLIKQRILRDPGYALDSAFQDPTQRKRQEDSRTIRVRRTFWRRLTLLVDRNQTLEDKRRWKLQFTGNAHENVVGRITLGGSR